MSNLRQRRSYNRWTQLEKACIVRMRSQGATLQDIANKLSETGVERNHTQVAKQVSRMKKTGDFDADQSLVKDD